MVWASTKTSVTNRTGTTRDAQRRQQRPARLAPSPRTVGDHRRDPHQQHDGERGHDQEGTCQPIALPSKVPAGTPGPAPAGSRPSRRRSPCPAAGGAMRRAYPASSAQAMPAATPATIRADHGQGIVRRDGRDGVADGEARDADQQQPLAPPARGRQRQRDRRQRGGDRVDRDRLPGRGLADIQIRALMAASTPAGSVSVRR